MKIKTKLAVSLGSLTAIMLIVGLFAINSVTRLEAQTNIYNALFTADLNLYQARLAQADFMLTQKREFINKVSEYLDKANSQLVNAREQMAVEASIQQVNRIQAEMRKFEQTFTELTDVVLRDGTRQEQTPIIARLLSAAQSATTDSDDLMEKEAKIAEQVRATVKTTIIAAIILALAISVSLGLWLSRAIMGPLSLSGNIANALKEQNLGFTAPVSGQDEFALLNQSLLNSISVLRKTMEQIQQVMDSLSASNHDVAQAIKKSNESLLEQKTETDALATALEEMAASTAEIASGADKAATTSAEAEKQAASGDTVISMSKAAMGNLSVAMQTATNSVHKLNEDSKNIVNIVQVIQGIAEQTNLLALNAAIEAARAGDQGRGFAVVADEVRQLAQRTSDSTSEITQLVELIQSGAQGAAAEIETSNNQAEEVLTLNDKASQAYIEISKSVNEISDINVQVATGAEEQSQVTAEVSRNVVTIKQFSDNNTETLEQIRAQVESQLAESEELRKLINSFRL